MKNIITLLLIFYCIDSFSQSKDDNTIYNTAGLEIRPEFPGGLEKLNAIVNENFQKEGFVTEIKTKVYSIFEVEKDGSLSDIKLLRDVDPLIANELIRILKSLPRSTPGMHEGKILRVLYSLPIVIGN